MRLSNTRLLGIIAIIGSPWMFIDFINNGLYDRFHSTSTSGIRNFIFMTGWICSVVGLYKLKAMGFKRWQKSVVIIQIVLLCLADSWCIFQIFAPDSPSLIFYVLNFSWLLAGFFMIITGIVIIRAKKLKGWKRYLPLLAGFWFPQTVLIYLIDPNSLTGLIISGIYATVVFSLLGFVLAISEYETSMKNKALYKS
jgi:hypothetical protein